MTSAARTLKLLPTLLGTLALLAAATYALLRSKSDAILPLARRSTSEAQHAGRELTVGPPDTLALTDGRMFVLLTTIAMLLGASAILLSYYRRRSGHRDHYSAAGLVFGAIAVTWSLTLALGGL